MKNIINTRKFIIFVILTILWTMLIFSFSLQPGEVSSEVSSGVGAWLIEVLFPELQQEMPVSQREFLHFLLRKAAHFTEFSILGLFVVQLLLQTGLRFQGLIGLMGCAVIAAVDETIQLFVIGRSGRIADVLLDSIGAAAGICLIILIKNFLHTIKTKEGIEYGNKS